MRALPRPVAIAKKRPRAGLHVLGALVAVLFFAGERNSAAALTTSEKAQVRDFVARGQLENVGRVRSLVARTDLTQEESVGALTDAFSGVPFDDGRSAFAKALVFGAASTPSRPLLTHATVKALLARADALYDKAGNVEQAKAGDAASRDRTRALSELASLYAF